MRFRFLALFVALSGCSGFSTVADDGGGTDGFTPSCGSTLPTRKSGSLLGAASSNSLVSNLAQGHDRIAVVWEDMARLRSYLALLDETGAIQLKPTEISGVAPAITTTKKGFALLLYDIARSEIVFLEIEADGDVLVKPMPLGANNLSLKGGYPAIASQDDGFVALYTAGAESTRYQLQRARLDSDGAPVDGWKPLTSSSGHTAIADVIATPDGGYAATWIDEQGAARHVHAGWLDLDGNLREKPGEVVVSADEHRATIPDVAVAPDGALMVCYSIDAGPRAEGDVLCGHVTTAGKVTTSERIADNPEVSSLAEVIWADGQYLVVYGDEQPGVGDVFGQFIHADGHRVGPIMRLTEISGTSGYPQVAWVDDGALVAWYQYRATTGWWYEFQLFPCE